MIAVNGFRISDALAAVASSKPVQCKCIWYPNCDYTESDRRALCQRDPLVIIDRWEELLEMSKGCSRCASLQELAGWLDLPLLLSV